MAKDHSTKAKFKTFNKRPTKKNAELTYDVLLVEAEKILTEQGLTLNNWSTVSSNYQSLVNSWDYVWVEQGVEFYFRRIWLDRLVDLIGIMIWNDINRQVFLTNGKNDKKSNKVADQAQEKFLRTFA